MNYADVLSRFRQRRGWTQKRLAKHVCEVTGRAYNQTNISRWETGAEAVPDTIQSWLDRAAPARVIAFANQKGGVAKTTSAVNIAYAIMKAGYKVLLIDADSQANATAAMGLNQRQLSADRRIISDALFETGRPDIAQFILPAQGLDVLPSGARLSRAEKRGGAVANAGGRLAMALASIKIDYDYIIIDCPPHLGIMTESALIAATHVVIPCSAGVFDMDGVEMILPEIAEAQEWANKNLKVLGLLPTRINPRHQVDQTLLQEMRETYGGQMEIFQFVPAVTDMQRSFFNGSIPLAIVPRDHPIGVYHDIAARIIQLVE